MEIKKELEEMAFATIGLAAMGADVISKTLEQATERGRQTMGQCKVKNEELQRKIRDELNNIVTITVQTNGDSAQTPTADELLQQIDKLTAEEKAALLAKLNATTQNNTDNAEQSVDKDNEPTT